MAATIQTASQWETVGKPTKGKGKSQIPQLSKSEKKNFIDNMPRIEKDGEKSVHILFHC